MSEPPDLQSTEDDRLQVDVGRVVEAEMARQNIPGLAVGIVSSGNTIFARGFGFADVDLSVACEAGTQFEIGSMTKLFTAVAVMQLVERGHLELDASLTDFLHDLPAGWRGITLRHLITHSSGIPSYVDESNLSGFCSSERTVRDVIAMVGDQPLQFTPGTQWAYSDTNFYLLGAVIEQSTGSDYWDYLKRNILEPADMSKTQPAIGPDGAADLAAGYLLEEEKLQRAPFATASSGWAAGSLISTVIDLAKWDIALTEGKLIQPETLEEMWTPATLVGGEKSICGLSWVIQEVNGHRHVWHNGGTAGFRSVFSKFPDDDFCVIVLTNQASCLPEKLAMYIAGILCPTLVGAENPR